METLYLVTGAAGHLAGAIIASLREQGHRVRGLILPSETPPEIGGAEYVRGDVTKLSSLDDFFSGLEDVSVTVIHAAGIISIADKVPPEMERVNVGGTKNVIAQCFAHGVRRLVHVSSVHALPELPKGQTIREVAHFDPDAVKGGYAKTKAEATQAVLDAAKSGLNAVVVHPSGIIGPGDCGRNHLNQVISMVAAGKLPAGVRGGYDLVDVRDVAEGCLSAAKHGRTGQCYILSNRYCSIEELFGMICDVTGRKRKPCLPIFLAKAAVPFFSLYADAKHQRPLFTGYSLYTLGSNSCFSHEKADAELGYRPRELRETVADTVHWLAAQKAPAGTPG